MEERKKFEVKLYTAKEIAPILGFSARTIQEWTRNRKISVLKLSDTCYRYHLPTVLSDLQQYEVPSKIRRIRGIDLERT